MGINIHLSDFINSDSYAKLLYSTYNHLRNMERDAESFCSGPNTILTVDGTRFKKVDSCDGVEVFEKVD